MLGASEKPQHIANSLTPHAARHTKPDDATQPTRAPVSTIATPPNCGKLTRNQAGYPPAPTPIESPSGPLLWPCCRYLLVLPHVPSRSKSPYNHSGAPTRRVALIATILVQYCIQSHKTTSLGETKLHFAGGNGATRLPVP